MPQSAQRTQQLGQILADLMLHAAPMSLIVVDICKRLLGTAGQCQGGIDRPRRRRIRQFQLRQCSRKQTAIGEALQFLDCSAASLGTIRQRCLSYLGPSQCDGTLLADLAQPLLLSIEVPGGGIHFSARKGQLLPQQVHLLTDGIAQRCKARASSFGTLDHLDSGARELRERIASLGLARALRH